MIRRLSELLPVKPSERVITALMFFYIFGVLTFYYILDPLRKGLFLSKIDASQLPYAYFLTAIVAGAVATLAFKVGQRSSAIALLTGINLAIIGTLVYFRLNIGTKAWYLPWLFFAYVKTISVLSTTQFWLLSGYIYDNRQAKRIYPLLGAGAGIGAITGSFVPAFLSAHFDKEARVMICIALAALLIVLSQIAWRYRRADAEIKAKPSTKEESKERLSDLWKLVLGSRHLAMVTLLLFVALIASQIADWQVDCAVQSTYGSLPEDQREAKITEFNGRFSFLTNSLSIVFQVLVTGFVVRRLGVFAAIVFLPLCLFLSSFSVVLWPSLLTAALARGSDTVSRYSLNRAGIELLYMPLAPVVRKRLKIFVDVFVDRAGRAVAGVVILLLTSTYFPFGLRGTAAVAMVLTLGGVLICISLGKSYVQGFREQLKRREADLGDFANYVTDPASVQLLVATLDVSNERQVLYSLQLLQSVRGMDFSEKVLPLLNHPSSYVREEALRTLHALPGDHSRAAEPLLADAADGVRVAAIDYLCSRDTARPSVRLEALLNHSSLDIRLGAVRWVSEHGEPGFTPPPDLIRGLMTLEGLRGAEAKAAAAGLTLQLPRTEAVDLLHTLIKDPAPEVRSAAAIAAGKGRHLDLLFPVLDMLKTPKLRGAARQALQSYGERIVGTLGDALGDASGDPRIRREIPWVLAHIPSRQSADRLTDYLGTEDGTLRYRVVRALDRLHESHPEIPIAMDAVKARIDAETRAYYETLSLRLAIESDGAATKGRLLPRAIRERQDQNLEITFQLLGLQYSQKEMRSAYVALKGSRKDRRTAAIEVLDNVLPQHQKSMILPLLEEASDKALLERGTARFGLKQLDRDAALQLMLSGPDPWLKVMALHEIGEKCIRSMAEACRSLAKSNDPWTRETAEWAIAKC